MKKIALFTFAVLFSTLLSAQKLTEIQSKDLPKATTDYIATNMPGSTVFKAVKAEDKGVITYNVAIDLKGRKHIMIFDKEGNFLKKGEKPPVKASATEQAPKK